jgi:crotonobetainyl-CoA:carnitine CoA-transferase CaiB-like acyl-CoA transferase
MNQRLRKEITNGFRKMEKSGDKTERRPLEGVRVVECGVFHAGPGACAILGDLGAEVIKIEAPGTGDPIRQLKRVGVIPFELAGNRSLFCEGANRNKKSVTINLKSEKGKDLLYRLIKKADVFLTNLRPKAIEKLKIEYGDLAAINPKIIYCSVSAFGDRGPERNAGGFDYQGQARAGIMFSLGGEEGMPAVSQFGLVDQTTAIMASHQILAALFMRERTGVGQEIKTSILGAAMFLNYFNILLAQMGRIEVPAHSRMKDNPLRNFYKGSDGRWIMITLTPSDRYWPSLCTALGSPELGKDERYDTDDKRIALAGEVIERLDALFAKKTSEEWLSIFADYDLVCSPVNRLLDLASDRQVIANNYLKDFTHPTVGAVKVPDYPCTFSGCRAGIVRAAPELGEHTEEVLRTLCGLDNDELRKLKGEGVI